MKGLLRKLRKMSYWEYIIHLSGISTATLLILLDYPPQVVAFGSFLVLIVTGMLISKYLKLKFTKELSKREHEEVAPECRLVINNGKETWQFWNDRIRKWDDADWERELNKLCLLGLRNKEKEREEYIAKYLRICHLAGKAAIAKAAIESFEELQKIRKT